MTKVRARFHAGAMMRAAREYRGVTQVEMAERLGVSQPRVAQMERRERCTVLSLAAVGDALDMELGYRESNGR